MTYITLADTLLDQLNLSDTAEPALIKMENEMLSMISDGELTLDECINKVRWACIRNAAERGYYDHNGRMKYLTKVWYEAMVEDKKPIMEVNENNDQGLTQEDMYRIDAFYLGKDLEMAI